MAAQDIYNEKSNVRKNPNDLAEFGFNKLITGEPMNHFKLFYGKPFRNALGKIMQDEEQFCWS